MSFGEACHAGVPISDWGLCMNTKLEAPAMPAMLVYADGTGRLVNQNFLLGCMTDVCTRYLEGDVLIDGFGRIFDLYRPYNELRILDLLSASPEPIDVTDRFGEAEIDLILARVCSRDKSDVPRMQLAIHTSRQKNKLLTEKNGGCNGEKNVV